MRSTTTTRCKIGARRADRVPVGGTTDKARDRFWGSVLVQLSPGTDVPLPSVAPDMRILSYEIKPKTTLTFSKDGADNFYVRSDESQRVGHLPPGVPRRRRRRLLRAVAAGQGTLHAAHRRHDHAARAAHHAASSGPSLRGRHAQEARPRSRHGPRRRRSTSWSATSARSRPRSCRRRPATSTATSATARPASAATARSRS